MDKPEPPPARVWEQRWHPFREEWVLFTSHRGGRPWLGEKKAVSSSPAPRHDPGCALCPRCRRLGDRRNPDYHGAWWFPNDLPCFGDESSPRPGDDLYRTRPAHGTAEVVCYHPHHDRTMADLTVEEVRAVVDLWTERSVVLEARSDVESVLVFENKGEIVGTSNPHPHGQIYAANLVYGHIAREAAAAERFHRATGRYLGLEVAAREASSRRVVAANAHFLACVPWFARYAYEVHVLPLAPAARLGDLDDDRRQALAAILREVVIRYDHLWDQPMPYVMAVHQAPADRGDHRAFPFHLELHPPLRKPDTLKYLAGPEVGGGSMTNESDPDQKAAELRAVAGDRVPKP